MLSAHGSTTPWRSCHQRSSTPASKPGIFQCGRPNGDQGGEIKDNRLHVPGLASRDGLDLDQRTDTVWPNQGTVSPLLVGLGVGARTGRDQWCLSSGCPHLAIRNSRETHLHPVLKSGATPGEEVLEVGAPPNT